ncbi:hypothetical protein KIL84_003368 [Mauremys mutica]|uniref:Uncharacterized protein n=1 Tax=Mauremys mutica TaxID=74926 RepID=A0A9D3WVR1_9SAUR|nr:hypothetical protein KIL84_003368 [Mauremys mutica]
MISSVEAATAQTQNWHTGLPLGLLTILKDRLGDIHSKRAFPLTWQNVCSALHLSDQFRQGRHWSAQSPKRNSSSKLCILDPEPLLDTGDSVQRPCLSLVSSALVPRTSGLWRPSQPAQALPGVATGSTELGLSRAEPHLGGVGLPECDPSCCQGSFARRLGQEGRDRLTLQGGGPESQPETPRARENSESSDPLRARRAEKMRARVAPTSGPPQRRNPLAASASPRLQLCPLSARPRLQFCSQPPPRSRPCLQRLAPLPRLVSGLRRATAFRSSPRLGLAPEPGPGRCPQMGTAHDLVVAE